MMSLDRALEAAMDISREAGTLILGSYRSPEGIIKKGEVDLVTSADLAAEKLIRRRLTALFPELVVLGEEGGEQGNRTGARGRWHVDPLDGTTNFAHGHPFFAVSIALELEGELVVGVVHAPAIGLTYGASKGSGATRNGSPISVSTTESLDDSLCASGFPYDRRRTEDDNTREWTAVMKRCQGVRRCGAAALDLALVAEGTYDGFWEKRLNSWDMAAGIVLIREAGGLVTGLDGSDVPPWPPMIVASNGIVHDELRDVVASVSLPLDD